jgi:hypothetical protein
MSGAAMTIYCTRCGHAIAPGEKYRTIDKFSSSGAGAILYVHQRPCTMPPTQTAPVRP